MNRILIPNHPMDLMANLLRIQTRITFRPLLLATILVCLSLAISGCNGHRPNLAANGSMKAALSQIQFENETLKAKIGKLEKQNRLLAADLQREESYSGTLATRLDESRNLLKRNGLNVPIDEESPKIVARADQNRDKSGNLTFGQVAGPRVRRSRYADDPADESKSIDDTLADEIPENITPKSAGKPKTLRPPAFDDDPEPADREVPELSANDLSTGWRRLSYRDKRILTDTESAVEKP
jgi:hypothetical protein